MEAIKHINASNPGKAYSSGLGFQRKPGVSLDSIVFKHNAVWINSRSVWELQECFGVRE